MASLWIVLGDQLFLPPAGDDITFFLREDPGLAGGVRHHQQKVALFFSAMRHWAQERSAEGRKVVYERLSAATGSYASAVAATGFKDVRCWRINDRPFAESLRRELAEAGITLEEQGHPGFLTTDEDWRSYRASSKRLLMADFYIRQRKQHGILVDEQAKPTGGQWSYDPENRKSLPKGMVAPYLPRFAPDELTHEVMEDVAEWFGHHPGDLRGFDWPVTRAQALEELDRFVAERLGGFGPYEDAVDRDQPFLWHSVLSPALNLGLLTPDEVVARVMAEPDIPLASREGFIRQVVGWREFIYQIYREYLANQRHEKNSLGHTRRLSKAWYDGTTGLPPLDATLRKVNQRGWCHHIERLMILGSAMVMAEVHPDEAYRWFLEMFVDAGEWVMVPNVYGMSQFADGGFFATKPYVSGSAYLLKMTNYPPGDWCEVWDGLYWRFIGRHRELFAQNPRMSIMVRQWERMADEKKTRLTETADRWIESVTEPGEPSPAVR